MLEVIDSVCSAAWSARSWLMLLGPNARYGLAVGWVM
jgi:hypothetical protein